MIIFHYFNKTLARLGIPCMHDTDCDGIKHSRCSMDKICICENNYARINERKCAPLIGGFCSADEHCITENAVCVDNRCQCKLDFVPISNKQCILGKFHHLTCL